ncbi:MAG: hypothetical protein QXY88_00670 [Candidatus Bathyarchaeia archaeon]
MVGRFWRSRWFIALLAVGILVSLTLAALMVDYGKREDEVLNYFSKQDGMPETFANLSELTPQGAVVLCWWDYGRAVREWSHREVIEAYPSRDIWYTLGVSRDPLHNLEMQIFGKWGSAEKIRAIATMFMLPEDQSLQLMEQYNVSHVLVFVPDELQKFYWIAHIAGYNATDYLIYADNQYQPTLLGRQTTLLRLIFDEELHPAYFTKLYDNGKGKIYRVNYSP